MNRPERRTDPEHLVVGRIVAPHGVRGEVRVAIETDDPERFARLERVYLGDERVPYAVEGARLHKGQALLRLRGIDDRDAAEAWRSAWVYVAFEDALPLDEDEYYHYQLVGLEAITDGGESLGRVAEILTTGANDVYVIRGPRGELLLPAIGEVVLEIDLEANRMVVRPPQELD